MEAATATAPVGAAENTGSSPGPTHRILEIKSDVMKSRNSICLERPTLLRKFQKSPEGRAAESEHPFVRRALTIAWMLSHRAPRIHPGELIIGNMTSKRVAGIYYPEGGTVNILEDVFRLERRANPIYLTFREKMRLLWIGLSTVRTSVAGRVFFRPGRFSHFMDFFRAKRYIISEEAGIGHQVVNYRRVVHEGLRASDEEAKRRLDAGAMPDGSPLSPDQAAFYKSVRVIIGGIRDMASNLADEAEKKAREPGLPEARREELLTSAEACRRVPYEPARTFLEGLQACWLVHVALLMEDYEQGMSFGRLDQILYPLFRRETDGGALSRERAMEMMASFHLKTCETMPVYSVRMDRYFSGNGVAQGLTLGGTDEEGGDVTNELSGLILDAFSWLHTREPALHARIHEDTPAWFMDKAVALVQSGCGKPSLFGDAAIVRALEGVGMTKAHARDYAIIGCVELASQGRTYNSSDAALFNLPHCLELALNEGRSFPGRLPSWKRVGAATPPPEEMTSFEEVVAAFRAQVFHSLGEVAKLISWIEEVYSVYRPTAINSILTDGCMEKGLDVTWGGGLYDFTSIQAVGLADAGDSLFAIKKLVFDEKRVSLAA
ncbi:MAG: hypothetical protein GY859_12080, partial [Desulfobacterales bacterium]|nr:hypothetical protein [Desulfobacterales bacterium]